MTGRFGWHSGNVHSKNIQAGTFVISGVVDELKDKAIVFPKKFSNVPKVFLQQQIRTGTTSDTSFGVVSGSSYNVPFIASGASITISGGTIAGFTAHAVFSTLEFNETVGTTGVASGVIVDYYAIDFINKG